MLRAFSSRLTKSYRPLWVLLALGQALDVLTFLVWSTSGHVNGTTERNFIIAFVVANFGLLGFTLLKLGYVTWIGHRLQKFKVFKWKVYSVLALAAASGFVGAAFNTWAIAR